MDRNPPDWVLVRADGQTAKAAKTAPPLSSAKQARLSLDAALLFSELAEVAQGSYQRMGMCGRSGGEP